MSAGAESSPIIVCGCQRSGTTAIIRILNDNGMMISNEWALFAWPAWQDQFSLTQWLENKRDEVQQNLWLQYWHYQLELTGSEAEEGFVAALHSVYGKRDAWRWGDKWSDYVFHIDTVKAHFPDAKIIYIYRDGRDVVASMLRKTIESDCDIGFKRWVASIEAWLSWRDRVDHLAIRQEDLLQYPEKVAASIAEYCGFTLESAGHAAYVLLGSDSETPEDHVSENPFKHTGAYHDRLADTDVPANAMRHLISLGYARP
ncbi:sulfotransferase [Phyllobacterium sp. YR531]|uniref:sulfotransferase family protein n=1 Tax=Phyllobacterium sp. YR531 TaxID=1144343 RepID=UPI00026F9061|nr:sulfotransferase [Phyllobacterium sp. YR531]EJM99227.1 sulfotransferase family protein [Phyllobacterium sp. YR531]